VRSNVGKKRRGFSLKRKTFPPFLAPRNGESTEVKAEQGIIKRGKKRGGQDRDNIAWASGEKGEEESYPG